MCIRLLSSTRKSESNQQRLETWTSSFTPHCLRVSEETKREGRTEGRMQVGSEGRGREGGREEEEE